ncbi:MAG: hypothetical protein KC646_15745 [Candidatus Cloacimonetes bacterium]|nr:hypothetical protein [Candidatus Cloacimonadota bacterium]
MPKSHPDPTFSKILGLCNILFLGFVCLEFKDNSVYAYEILCIFFVLPLSLTSILFFINLRPIATIILVLWLGLLASNPIGHGPSYEDYFYTTKSNLSSIKTAIEMYYKSNSSYPFPNTSGATRSTLNENKTLESILSNVNGHGDGVEYILGAIPGEMLSDFQGNNFVCVVDSLKKFYTDQTKLKNCINPDLYDYSHSGGYLYYPESGLLRLNLKVTGNLTVDKTQFKVSELNPIWTKWSQNRSTITTEFPVLW